MWGLQGRLVLGTIKHFPSVGPTSLDSHAELPVSDMSEQEFRDTVLVPFKAAIDSGADAMMTGHIIFESPLPSLEAAGAGVGTPEAAALAQAAADATMVLLREQAGVLPLSPEQHIAYVGPGHLYLDAGSGWWNIVGLSLGEALAEHATVTSCEVELPPVSDLEDDCLAIAAGSDVVVMASINAHYSPEQISFLSAMLEAGPPAVLVTLGVPYDAWDIPAGTAVAATGQRSVSVTAAAKALFGEIPFSGQPSVDMSP